MPDQEADEYVVSDPELITRVRTGDREAFGELYKRHAGAATTLSRQFARSATESDDLVSESFARVLDNLLAGKGPDTAFRAYLFTTIRHTAYDRTRKDKRLQFTDDMTPHDIAVVGADPVLAKMESGLVATAFAQLPERWQAVLWHTQVEGETPAQVGAMLGMAPGAVSSLAFRAREGLREAYLQAHLAETAAEQCRTTVERLGAWTRGGLSKREKTQVDAHLETCDRCRALAAELEEVNHGLRGLLAPLLLGGAAAGYLATLGPVAPLAAPGTLIAGAGSTGAGGSGAGGSGAGGSGAGGSGAGGSGAGGGASAGGGAGAGGAAGAGAAGGAAAGSAAATAAGVAAAAAAAGAIGLAALASTGSSGSASAAAAGTGSAGAGGAASGGAGASAATAGTGSAGTGGAAGGGSAAGGGGAAAAGGAAGAGTAAAGTGGIFASLGVGGLVAAGAVVVVAAVAAVVFVVSGNSPDTTNTAGQDVGASDLAQSSATGTPTGNDPGPATGISIADPGAAGTAVSAPVAPGGVPGTTGTPNGVLIPVVNTTAQPTAPATGGAVPDTSVADAGLPASTTSVPTTPDPAATDSTAPPTTAPLTTAPLTTAPATTAPATTSTTIAPPPPTADLVVTDLTAQTLNAGGTGTVSMTVTNNGDAASGVTPIDLVLPTGVQVTDVAAGAPVPALRRATAGLLRAGPCLSEPSTSCSVDLPAVAAHQKITVTLTLELASTATGGDLKITVLGKSVSLILKVNSPAALTFVDFREVMTPTAGGNGQLALDVSNNGQQASIDQEIEVGGLPDSVTPTDITIAGASTCDQPPAENARVAAGMTCTLPPLNPDEDITLLIDLEVQPSAPPTVAPSVTIGGSLAGELGSLTVVAGITGLDTSPAGPFLAGRPLQLSVTPEVPDTINAGNVTLTSDDPTVTFGSVSGCDLTPQADAVTCPGNRSFTVPIAIPATHATGDLLINAVDEGQRQLRFTSPLRIQAASPAAPTLGELSEIKPLIAGGTGRLTVVVTNTGQQTSLPDEITVDGLPDGVSLSDITIDGTSVCDAPQAENALVAAAASSCRLLPLEPGQADIVLIDLDVAPIARTQEGTDATTVSIVGNLTSASLPLTVLPGIVALDTAPSGPFTAGQPVTLTVTPELQETVTDVGPITLTSPDDTVTFGPSTGCTPAAESNAVTCTTSPFDLDIIIPVDHAAGSLQITAADAGQRPLGFPTVAIVAAAPANLEVTGLTVSQPPIAGGNGELTVEVANTGALPSPEQSIVVGLPLDSGITVTRITDGKSELCGRNEAGITCALPALEAGEARTLVITMAVPTTTVSKPGTATVTIGDGPANSDSVRLTVDSGITALTTSAKNPLYTGSTTTLPIEVESRIEKPGPITFYSTGTGVTFDKSAGCNPPVGTSTIVCDGTSISLSITISAQQQPGDLPVTVTDAGGRKLDLKDAAGNDFVIERALSSLHLDKLAISTPLLAGGTGDLTVQVRNTGGRRSEKQPIKVDLPDGVQLMDMTIGDSSICTPALQGAPTCGLPELDPDESVAVVIALDARPEVTEKPGAAKVVVADDSDSIPLAVSAGISSLVAAEKGPITAGSTVQLTVAPELLKGVTDAGPIRLTATAGVTFGESKTCTPANGGSIITCTGTKFTFTVIVPASLSAGELPVTAADAGNRQIELLGADRQPFAVVAAQQHLDVSELTVLQVPNLSGTISLKVTNPADTASSAMPIDISLPRGFTTRAVVSVFEPAFRVTVCTNTPCTLGSISPKGSATLYIGFSAGTGAITGPAKVTIDGVTKEKQIVGAGLTLELLTPSDATAPAGTTTPGPEPAIGSDLDKAFGLAPATPTPAPAPSSEPPGTPAGPTEPSRTDVPATNANPTGTAPATPQDSDTPQPSPTTDASRTLAQHAVARTCRARVDRCCVQPQLRPNRHGLNGCCVNRCCVNRCCVNRCCDNRHVNRCATKANRTSPKHRTNKHRTGCADRGQHIDGSGRHQRRDHQPDSCPSRPGRGAARRAGR